MLLLTVICFTFFTNFSQDPRSKFGCLHCLLQIVNILSCILEQHAFIHMAGPHGIGDVC